MCSAEREKARGGDEEEEHRRGEGKRGAIHFKDTRTQVRPLMDQRRRRRRESEKGRAEE